MRLQLELQGFVSRKVATDARWRDVTVIFSGHEVPGEGEHKIMDFIRSEKMRPNYDSRTRHCLYGEPEVLCVPPFLFPIHPIHRSFLELFHLSPIRVYVCLFHCEMPHE